MKNKIKKVEKVRNIRKCVKKCPFGRTPLFLRCEEVKKVWKVVCIKCGRNVFVTIWDLYWQWLVTITSVKPVLKFTRHDKMLSIYFIQSATCICGRHCRTCLWNQSYTAQGTIKCDRDLFVTICNLYWRWLVSNTSVIPVLKFTRHDKKWSRFIFHSMRATCICGHRRTCLWNQFYTSQCTIKCCRDLLVTICDLYWRQTLSNTSVKPVLYCTSHEKVWKSWKRNTDVAEYNVLGLVPRSTRSAAAVPFEKVWKKFKKVSKSWKSSKKFEKVRKRWNSLKKFVKVEEVWKSSKKLKQF